MANRYCSLKKGFMLFECVLSLCLGGILALLCATILVNVYTRYAHSITDSIFRFNCIRGVTVIDRILKKAPGDRIHWTIIESGRLAWYDVDAQHRLEIRKGKLMYGKFGHGVARGSHGPNHLILANVDECSFEVVESGNRVEAVRYSMSTQGVPINGCARCLGDMIFIDVGSL